ncbi:hypothetical protein [Streptomyces sp. CA-288835]|uniref:hypothetical protein n=1 Tax=Streptomyces sp. CA-288835 TaxID=3240069 RepID=UPI003D8DD651
MADVRLAFQADRAMWETIRSGVQLGAEEVQDQRLRALETPPEANPLVDTFLLIVMWSLEGPLVAILLGVARKMLANALERKLRLQARAYGRLVAGDKDANLPGLLEARRIVESRSRKAQKRIEAASRGGHGRQQRAQRAIEHCQAGQKELEKITDAKASLRRTALALRGIRLPDLPEYVSAYINVRHQQPDRSSGPPESGIPYGVTFRAQVEKHARALIEESHFQEQLYEALIARDKQLTAERAADILEDIGPPIPIDYGAMLDVYQILSAARIWAELLSTRGLLQQRQEELKQVREVYGDYYEGPPLPYGLLFPVPDKHRQYLAARFGPLAEAWARRFPKQVRLPGAYPGTFGPPSPREVETFIAAGRGSAPKTFLDRIVETLGTSADSAALAVRADLVMQWFSTLTEQSPEELLRSPTP